MQFRKRQRVTLLIVALLMLGGAASLILTAMQDTIAFFVSPTDLATMEIDEEKSFRIGGLVVDGSVEQLGDGQIAFALTDTANEVRVVYKGILPDLFREGQGIVAQGKMTGDRQFVAAEVLAKHDENYMPKEVADALKQAGHWQAEEHSMESTE